MESPDKRRGQIEFLSDLKSSVKKRNEADVRRRPRPEPVQTLHQRVPSPHKSRSDGENIGLVELRRASILESSMQAEKQKNEYITKYEQVRASIKGIKTELEAIEKRRDLVDEYELDRLNGRAKLNDPKGERVTAKLSELAGKDLSFWLDIRDISHDQWQKCLDFEQYLVQERNRHFKEISEVKNTLMKRLEWFKEKTYLRITSLEKENASMEAHNNRLEIELRMKISDYESQAANQEYKFEEMMKNDTELGGITDLPTAIKRIEKLNAARRALVRKYEDVQETAKTTKNQLSTCKQKLKASRANEAEYLDKCAQLLRGLEELLSKSKLSPAARMTIADHLKSNRIKQAVGVIFESQETVSRNSSKETIGKKSDNLSTTTVPIIRKNSSRRMTDKPKDPKKNPAVIPNSASLFITGEPEISNPITERSIMETDQEREMTDLRLTMTLSTTPFSQNNFQELQTILANFIEKSLAENCISLNEMTSVRELTIAELLQLNVHSMYKAQTVVELIKEGLANLFVPKKVSSVDTKSESSERRKSSFQRRPTMRSFVLKTPLQSPKEGNSSDGILELSRNLVIQSFVDGDKEPDLSTIEASGIESHHETGSLSNMTSSSNKKALESVNTFEPLPENDPAKFIDHVKSYKPGELGTQKIMKPARLKETFYRDVSFLKEYLPKPEESGDAEMSQANYIRWEKLLCAINSKIAKDLGRTQKIAGNELEVWEKMSWNLKHVQHRLIKYKSIPYNIDISNAIGQDGFSHPITVISNLRHRNFVINPLNSTHKRINSNSINPFNSKRSMSSKRSSMSHSQDLSLTTTRRDEPWLLATPRMHRF
mmetsp:Transcript_11104/g.21751  ORF Transcript_11104/g.21751 Transcript_11104/m.21751 type:complete len:831 (+) Transcript_11104:32-2524(+)